MTAPDRVWLIGLLTVTSLLLPLLGGAFSDITGIHPRPLSYALILILFLQRKQLSIKALISYKQTATFALITLLALAVLLSTDWTRPLWQPEMHTRADYPSYKFTRIWLISAPAVLAAAIAAPVAAHPKFLNGARSAALLVGAIALIELALNRTLLSTGYTGWSALQEEARFSTISLSYIFFTAVLAAAPNKDNSRTLLREVAFWLIWALGLGCTFLTAQRTAFAATGLVAPAVILQRLAIHRESRTSAIRPILGVALLLGFYIIIAVGVIDLDVYETQSSRFHRITTGHDTSWDLRVEAWRYAIARGIQTPAGHGLGHFVFHSTTLHYPHNVFIETLFELGWVGFLPTIGLLGLTALTLPQLWRGRQFFLFGALAGHLAFVSKAGDLSSAGLWPFWLIISTAPTLRRHSLTESRGSKPLVQRSHKGNRPKQP